MMERWRKWCLWSFFKICHFKAFNYLPHEFMVSAHLPCHYNGGLNLKICRNFVGTNFFLGLCRNKPLWGELKLYGGEGGGGVIFSTAISLFHFFRNRQYPEKWSVSVKDFFRKCECIRSCYLPISAILLKNSLRKTSLFVFFELLPTCLFNYVWPFVTTQHEWANNFPGFLARTLVKK